jgi:dienelactone hydrolase
MAVPIALEPDPAEPLAACFHAAPTPAVFGDARCQRFELSSRGDRVPGRLLLPPGGGPFPLILLQHGLGGSKESPYLETSAPWVRGGAAVASIDFPLHGERASAKLSQRLLAGVEQALRGEDAGDAVSAQLWIEFTRQAVFDLRRALDALERHAALDVRRVAYGGFSLGGMLGALFCASDERPRGAALALAGGGFGPAEVDPCRYVGRIAPRPLLLVNAKRDERIARRAAEALFAAAGEPKRHEWFEATHVDLPGRALKSMWLFLREQLSL